MNELKLKDVVMLLNKNAIAVRLKEGFLKWLESIDNTIDIEEAGKERRIYIIPSLVMLDDEIIEGYLRENYKKIFATELWGWYTDIKMWPEEISYEVFREWFEIEICDAVYDIEKREKDII